MSLKYMQGAFKQAGCRTSARGCQARCAADGQRAIFDNKVAEFKQDLPDEVTERLTSVVKSALMSPEDRVLDVGTGAGGLIPYIQSQGVRDILAIDVSPKMLAEVQKTYEVKSKLGNEPCVRTWLGAFEELPMHQGRADVIFMNAVYGNLQDPHAALLHSSTLLNPGGRVVISHPLGRKWHTELHKRQPKMVPHELPSLQALDDVIHDLPFTVRSFVDEEEFYNAVLAIPPQFSFGGAPIRLQGPVVEGFGRGSKQMGVPTANLLPTAVEAMLKGFPKGVYFGWAQLQRAGEDEVVAMVMNYGERPSIQDGSHNTIEAHLLADYPQDFHGCELSVLITGFIRPEMKFESLPALVNRIQLDISIAKAQLDHETSQAYKEDSLFSQND